MGIINKLVGRSYDIYICSDKDWPPNADRRTCSQFDRYLPYMHSKIFLVHSKGTLKYVNSIVLVPIVLMIKHGTYLAS